MGLQEYINETFESQKEIEKIANAILFKATFMFIKQGNGFKYEHLLISMDIDEATYSGPLEDFFNWLEFIQFTRASHTGQQGGYSPPEKAIVLYYPVSSLFDMESKENDAKYVKSFLNIRYDTLVHELTHAYDDFRSNGKAIGSSSKAVLHDDGMSSYLKLQHEIDARFAQAIVKPNVTKHKLFPSKGKHRIVGGFDNYLREIKDELRNWYELDEVDKKRMIKRAYTFYQTLSKDEQRIMTAGALTSIFWNFVYGERNNYKLSDDRYRVDLKKEARQLVMDILSKRISPITLESTHLGTFNALVQMADDMNSVHIDTMARELKLHNDAIMDLLNIIKP